MPGIASLQFLGASGTVTGSKYWIRCGRSRVLLDCGLFQGLKELRLRNWQPPVFDPSQLDAVVLSHAHIDHSGALPLLMRQRFREKIFCTSGTVDLLRILLLDSAHLQEEQADYANRHGFSKHHPALPLYTTQDAELALEHLRPCAYDKPTKVTDDITAVFRRAGHILGSATVELQLGSPEQPFRLVSSGDLGRWNQPILRPPAMVPEADLLLLESTYGDRIHPSDPASALERVIKEAADRGGALLIPAFAVDRTQLLMWIIHQLEESGRVPSLPVYVDSPMAINVSDLYCRHPEDHSIDMATLMDEKRCPLMSRQLHLVRTQEESKQLNQLKGPMIIISSSGMATGGRILHHLEHRLPDPRTTVLLAGFQAAGTRGRSLQEGAKTLRMHGQNIPVLAKVETVDGLSAHADREEIFRWLSGFRRPPQQTYIVHGEPSQAEALAQAIRDRLGWSVQVARNEETVEFQVTGI